MPYKGFSRKCHSCACLLSPKPSHTATRGRALLPCPPEHTLSGTLVAVSWHVEWGSSTSPQSPPLRDTRGKERTLGRGLLQPPTLWRLGHLCGSLDRNTGEDFLFPYQTLPQSIDGNTENFIFEDFPGVTVVKKPPADAGDTGSSPGPGRSHMSRSN